MSATPKRIHGVFSLKTTKGGEAASQNQAVSPCQSDTEEEANKKFQNDTYLFTNGAISGSCDFLKVF